MHRDVVPRGLFFGIIREMTTRILLILGLSFGFAAACESDDDGNDDADGANDDDATDTTDSDDGDSDACGMIASICHDNPENDPEISACHDVGHDDDLSVCTEQLEHCLDLCDGGHDDTGTGTGDDHGTGTDTDGTDGTDDTGGTGGTGTETACEQIASQCHENPDSDPAIEECHEFGHDGDETVCEEHLSDCLELCTH